MIREKSRLAALATTLAALALVTSPPILSAEASLGPTSVECSQIQSSVLSRAVNYCVALPADYNSSGKQRYPTLYFLHGMFENERSWVDRGGKEILDGMLAHGEAGPFLVVLPDAGRTFYVNSLDGTVRYEDFFIQELIPFIDQHYRTIPQAAARGISGVSMGGYGALRYAMRHAGLFGAASSQSAALLPKFPNPIPTEGRWGFYARVLQGPFGSPLNEAYWEANNPLTLAEHPEGFAGLKLYFDCGDQDRYGFQEGNELLDQVLSSKGFPHEFVLRPGNHGWSYLEKYMQYALLFHWRSFQPAEQSVAATPASQAPSHADPTRSETQTEAEARVVNYIRDHLRPGQPLLVTQLYNQVFTETAERQALDKLYRAFFRIPLFVAEYNEQFHHPPSLATITEQFDLRAPGAADVLLRVMESDPRVPRFLTRDPKSGEITKVDVELIRSDPRFGSAIEHQLAGWEGRRAPAFKLPGLEGGEFDLASLAGKPAVLYVWFTGCPPCLKETPVLVSLGREFAGLQIVGANADRLLGLSYDDAVRRRYVSEHQIMFPVAHWTKEADTSYGGISIFPTLFLIDSKGTVRRHWVGFVSAGDLRAAVAQVTTAGIRQPDANAKAGIAVTGH